MRHLTLACSAIEHYGAMTTKQAQSTLEYILVLVAILLVLLAAIGRNSSPIRTGLSNYLNELGNKIGGIMDAF
jgi:hypothetical protein